MPWKKIYVNTIAEGLQTDINDLVDKTDLIQVDIDGKQEKIDDSTSLVMGNLTASILYKTQD
jgi:uncharacterized protein YoxC